MNSDFTMVATTLAGLEEVLANELRKLGAKNVEIGTRSVSFVGDIGFLYKANLSLRSAIRIVKPIAKFIVSNEQELYTSLLQFKWDSFIQLEQTFAIHASVNSKYFTTNSHYISLKTKDGIVDYFRKKYQKRPNVSVKDPDIKINIHIHNETCIVSLDSSGDSLHKRGYKSATNIAPINEVLAAGLVLLSGYDGTSNFIDPMCGSGTILIEAAMIAANIPANINRSHFAFMNWQDFDESLFEKIKNAQLQKIKDCSFKIIGYDKAPSAVRKATDNISNANLEEFITIEQKDFFKSSKEVEGPTTLIFNPPYGRRLSVDIEAFYSSIGSTLKHQYPNTTAWFITSDIGALKYVGLKTSRKIHLKNGDLDCKYVRYTMYEGTKKRSS